MEKGIPIDIPVKTIQMILDCKILQDTGSIASTEIRMREVERIERHVAEIVIGIVLKEFNNQKRIQHDKPR